MKKYLPFALLIVAILMGVGVWCITSKNNNGVAPQPSAPSPIAQVVYICNGDKTIDAAFYKGETKPVKVGEPPIPTGSVKLNLNDGRKFDLSQTISADGGRYANSDESFVFWSKGDRAMVLENNKEKDYTGCIVAEYDSLTPTITPDKAGVEEAINQLKSISGEVNDLSVSANGIDENENILSVFEGK